MQVSVAEMAVPVLKDKGFDDKQADHPWNMVQMERSFSSGTLTVWGRSWGDLKVQIYQGYEDCLHLWNGEDQDAMLLVVDKAIDFLSFLSCC